MSLSSFFGRGGGKARRLLARLSLLRFPFAREGGKLHRKGASQRIQKAPLPACLPQAVLTGGLFLFYFLFYFWASFPTPFVSAFLTDPNLSLPPPPPSTPFGASTWWLLGEGGGREHEASRMGANNGKQYGSDGKPAAPRRGERERASERATRPLDVRASESCACRRARVRGDRQPGATPAASKRPETHLRALR